jgi:hypothetical protein
MAATADGLAQMRAILQGYVQDWHVALADPAAAQEQVLHRLLRGYVQTGYGRERGAVHIETIDDYRRAFPALTYDEYTPLLERVWAGEADLLLYQEPVGIAMTRGTARGTSKLIPMTPDDLRGRVAAGRALINYVLRSGQFEILQGVNLNLNFPSAVRSMRVGDRQVDVGYSSGIYVRHVTSKMLLRTLPQQADIDALGGTTEVSAWERRFELAYRTCRDENVTIVGGVSNSALHFGRYLSREHGLRPKDVWQVRVMTLGSQPGITTQLLPALRANWGRDVEVVEIYGATEGMFGQQMDERKLWTPNYDLFFFEVEVGGQVKMLHEMRPGEVGSLVVSTVVFPRYKMLDLVRAYDAPYFRTIGRDQPWTRLRDFWQGVLRFDFGRA